MNLPFQLWKTVGINGINHVLKRRCGASRLQIGVGKTSSCLHATAAGLIGPEDELS
jgi:hypothetical protein